MNYLNIIERYSEHRAGLQELLASILSGIASPKIIVDATGLNKTMQSLTAHYPFADLIYTLDQHGVQTSDNISGKDKLRPAHFGKDKDRSQRPYFLLARNTDKVVVTEPYLSSASNKLCMSAVVQLRDKETAQTGYLVLDLDLAKTTTFFMGDSSRSHFEPVFKFIYSLIVLGLFSVVMVLLYSAFSDIATLFHVSHTLDAVKLKPFTIIIFILLLSVPRITVSLILPILCLFSIIEQ